jgi:Mn-dependent DtxR family transcriptional regulator
LLLHKSGEDYLEAILILQKQRETVRSIDLVHYTGYSKASISHAVSTLEKCGLLKKDQNKYLQLTPMGKEVAERIYEKHCVLSELLIRIGVSQKTAQTDACRIEHVISDESLQKLKEWRKIRL